LLTIRRLRTTNVAENRAREVSSLDVVNQHSHFGKKNVQLILIRVNMHLAYKLVIPLLAPYLREMNAFSQRILQDYSKKLYSQ
jgi:hypothetical protein